MCVCVCVHCLVVLCVGGWVFICGTLCVYMWCVVWFLYVCSERACVCVLSAYVCLHARAYMYVRSLVLSCKGEGQTEAEVCFAKRMSVR